MSRLLPYNVARTLPSLYATEHEDDPIVRVGNERVKVTHLGAK